MNKINGQSGQIIESLSKGAPPQKWKKSWTLTNSQNKVQDNAFQED